jgi:hypothetical protein
MRSFYGKAQRALQDRFDSRPMQDALSAADRGRAEAAGGRVSMEEYMRMVGEGSPEA